MREPSDPTELDLDTITSLELEPIADLSLEDPAPQQPADGPRATAEAESLQEVSQVLNGFRQRAREEEARFREATDTEYWFAVCFQSREQKEAFLKAMDWFAHGDKYLDGTQLAKEAGIKLPPSRLKFPPSKADRRMGVLKTIGK